MDNVFIKGAGIRKLWKNLIEDFKKDGCWNNVFWEHSNQGIKQSKNKTTVFPKAVHEHKKFNTESVGLRLKLQDKVLKFHDFFSRLNSTNQNHYGFIPIHEAENIFNILVNHYFSVFSDGNFTLLILNRPPHIGQDYVAYEVAKAMGIKTLILFQTHQFKGRFFHVFDNDDFGMFETSVHNEMEEIAYQSVTQTFKKKLEYMDSFYKKKGSIKTKIAKSKWGKSILEIYKGAPIENAIKRHKVERNFEKCYITNSKSSVDFTSKYVYFPLHLQPEMTTSNWGGIYCDQVLAVEHLSSILPSGWKIYVKENPKQSGFQRGPFFYKRLKAIQNTHFIAKEVDTYKLLENCQIAATITGTVGWEAITGGKPAIVFGFGAWYKNFPGVYSFCEDLDLEQIADTQINHNEVEQAYNELFKYTHKGVIYAFGDIDNPKKEIENRENVYKAMKNILQYSK